MVERESGNNLSNLNNIEVKKLNPSSMRVLVRRARNARAEALHLPADQKKLRLTELLGIASRATTDKGYVEDNIEIRALMVGIAKDLIAIEFGGEGHDTAIERLRGVVKESIPYMLEHPSSDSLDLIKVPFSTFNQTGDKAANVAFIDWGIEVAEELCLKADSVHNATLRARSTDALNSLKFTREQIISS